MACDEGILPLDERIADAADEAEPDDVTTPNDACSMSPVRAHAATRCRPASGPARSS